MPAFSVISEFLSQEQNCEEVVAQLLCSSGEWVSASVVYALVKYPQSQVIHSSSCSS
jgi:hypothetical protein